MNLLHVNFILLGVCVLFTTIGYSALKASVSIAGDLTYRADAEIRISSVLLSNSNDGAMITYVPKHSVSTLSLGTQLGALDSTLTYKVTVTNKSNKFKKILSHVVTSDNNTDIVYSLTDEGYQMNNLILPNSSVELYFKFNYKSGLSALPATINEDTIIKLSYADATLTARDLYYDNSKTGLDADNVQDALDKIAVMIEENQAKDATKIYYDNTKTGIDADNVQDALDIIAELLS